MENAKYWEKRSIALEDKLYKDTTKFEKALMNVYSENAKELEKDIVYFINKYADENGLSYSQASKRLTKIEINDYRKQIENLLYKYEKTGSPELLKRMEELKTRAIVTRLDSLKGQIDARMYAMTEVMTNDTREHLEEIYENAYYGYGEDFVEGMGLNMDEALHSINFKIPENLTNYPYSGMMFSERIWKCTDKLSQNVKEVLQRGMVQGKSVKQMTRELNEILKQKGVTGYRNYDLTRVVRTETAFVREQASADIHKKYGVKMYSIVVAPDERTCRKCQAMHGEVFMEEERAMGYNAPPFHPNCRCTTIVEGEFKYGDIVGEPIENEDE